MHIFVPTRTGAIYWAILALMWGNTAFYGAVWLITIFECVPQADIWNPQSTERRCIDFNAAYVVTGAANVLSDLLILLLPMLAIWRLQMEPKRKLGVAAVFATGFMYVLSNLCISILVYLLKILLQCIRVKYFQTSLLDKVLD